MMTKNVGQAHIYLYFDLLNLSFGTGRAEIAQNLHSMREKTGKLAAKPITSDTGGSTRTLRTIFADCLKPAIA